MTELRLTEHARTRMQKRAISPSVIEALLDFGQEEHDHHGGCILYFDKAARRRLERKCLDRMLNRYLDAYAVLAETGEIITVGHRDRRIFRH
ncbi:MAG: DUF4258 domain-containing protein [Bryobacterales bacterium]|nr:DUF4258 domain-containing protein [Bryobacterales bacterium]MCZ2157185.1 DUF4258 domain-containing protein [Bryobacterales bacterium]